MADEYGALIEYLDAMMIYDTTVLPRPKDEIKLALKTAWTLTSDSRRKNTIEGLYTCLSCFQDGVGRAPVRCDLPGDASSRSSEGIDATDAVRKLSKRVERETDRLLIEIEAFLAEQKLAVSRS